MRDLSLDEMLKELFPKKGTGVCVICGSDKTKPEDFDSDIARKEWGISEMCQNCQNKAFSTEEDE